LSNLVVGFPRWQTVSDDPRPPKLAKTRRQRGHPASLDLVVLTKDTSGDIAVAEFDELDQFR